MSCREERFGGGGGGGRHRLSSTKMTVEAKESMRHWVNDGNKEYGKIFEKKGIRKKNEAGFTTEEIPDPMYHRHSSTRIYSYIFRRAAPVLFELCLSYLNEYSISDKRRGSRSKRGHRGQEG